MHRDTRPKKTEPNAKKDHKKEIRYTKNTAHIQNKAREQT